MKKLILLIIGFSLLTSSSWALLSPLNQSIKEIEAILASPELQKHFSQSDIIQEIRREDDCYIIESEDKQVVIMLTYIPSHRIGPKEFKLVFPKN